LLLEDRQLLSRYLFQAASSGVIVFLLQPCAFEKRSRELWILAGEIKHFLPEYFLTPEDLTLRDHYRRINVYRIARALPLKFVDSPCVLRLTYLTPDIARISAATSVFPVAMNVVLFVFIQYIEDRIHLDVSLADICLDSERWPFFDDYNLVNDFILRRRFAIGNVNVGC
jgi:hypothetical protein